MHWSNQRKKCLVVVTTDESKDTLKKSKELWKKIRDLIRSKTNNSENYKRHVKNMRNIWEISENQI